MGKAFLGRWASVGVLIALVPLVTFSALLFADWREARHRAPGPLPSLGRALDRGDRLHYVGHLALGRLYDLCPCTERLAAEQYERAEWHTRTERQQALVTSERPRTLHTMLSDLGGIMTSGLRWGHQGTAWLLARLARP
jgi:hypothetical protein